MRFKIWYDEGECFNGETEQDWEKLPRYGVLIIKEFLDDGGMMHMGLDYYWYEDGQIKSCNRNDIDRYLGRDRGIGCVKFGRWASNYIWEKARKESEGDCGDCPEIKHGD